MNNPQISQNQVYFSQKSVAESALHGYARIQADGNFVAAPPRTHGLVTSLAEGEDAESSPTGNEIL